MKTWILVANAAEAKILTSDNIRVGELELINEFIHPESRKKAAELISDQPGKYISSGHAHGAYIKSDPKEVEAEHFAIELAQELKSAWDQRKYKKLIVVTPAHFYGLLKKHFQENNSLELTYISKDYTKNTAAEVHEHLKKILFG